MARCGTTKTALFDSASLAPPTPLLPTPPPAPPAARRAASPARAPNRSWAALRAPTPASRRDAAAARDRRRRAAARYGRSSSAIRSAARRRRAPVVISAWGAKERVRSCYRRAAELCCAGVLVEGWSSRACGIRRRGRGRAPACRSPQGAASAHRHHLHHLRRAAAPATRRSCRPPAGPPPGTASAWRSRSRGWRGRGRCLHRHTTRRKMAALGAASGSRVKASRWGLR